MGVDPLGLLTFSPLCRLFEIESFGQNNHGTAFWGSGFPCAANDNNQRQVLTLIVNHSCVPRHAADGKLLGTYNLAGVPVEETVFLGDIPVAVLVGNEAWSVYADHLNAPRRVVDGSGATRWGAWDRADPFGKAQPNQNPSLPFKKFSTTRMAPAD